MCPTYDIRSVFLAKMRVLNSRSRNNFYFLCSFDFYCGKVLLIGARFITGQLLGQVDRNFYYSLFTKHVYNHTIWLLDLFVVH